MITDYICRARHFTCILYIFEKIRHFLFFVWLVWFLDVKGNICRKFEMFAHLLHRDEKIETILMGNSKHNPSTQAQLYNHYLSFVWFVQKT